MIFNSEKLESIGKIVTGGTPSTSKKENYGGEFLWAGPSDLDQGKYILSTNRRLSAIGRADSRTRIIPKNSLLISCIGNIGKLSISKEEMATNQQINTFVPNESIIDIEYVYYFLLGNKHLLFAEASATTVPILNKSKLSRIKIRFPSLSEQKQIVSKIKECFNYLDKAEEKLKRAEDRLDKVLDSSLITIQKESGKVYPLKEIVTVQKQTITLSAEQTSFYIALEDIEANTGKLLNKRYINGSQVKSTKLKFNTAHVLYSKLRPYLNKVIIPQEEGICVTDLLPLLPNEKVTQKYLYYYLRSPQIRDYINQKMAGIKMPRLRTEDLNNMPIFVPSIEDQNKIVSKIELLTEESYTSKKILKELTEKQRLIRQSILKKAFEGKLI